MICEIRVDIDETYLNLFYARINVNLLTLLMIYIVWSALISEPLELNIFE